MVSLSHFDSQPSPFALFTQLTSGSDRVLLESCGEGGGHSYLAWDPWARFEAYGENCRITIEGKVEEKKGNPFRLLEEFVSQSRKIAPAEVSGAFGFISYEANRFLERLPRPKPDPELEGFPDMYFIVPRREMVMEHQKEGVCHPGLDPGSSVLSKTLDPGFRRDDNQSQFEAMVRRAKEYISSGDIYQANLSQRFSFDFSGDALGLYERLRRINPSPYSAFLDFGGIQIVSSSPELLVRVRDGVCQTRPIAGTRRRGASADEDRKLQKNLLLSPKEKAEHLMLVDLERNDLGRVCDFDTVAVDQLMTLEKYSHVIHIVSNISGRLAKGKTSFDVIGAMFPGGTITGCPKIRSMEIIHELEPVRRGIYTGSIARIGFDGSLDLNIVIRTIVCYQGRGLIQVGAGIVHDSVPSREYEETLHKAQAMMEAVNLCYSKTGLKSPPRKRSQSGTSKVLSASSRV